MRRIVRAILLLLVAVTLFVPLVAGEGLSLRLTDPTTGSQARVEPGARALHLVFLATWCSPCLDELDALGELEARWNGHGYRLVLIAVPTRQTAERLARFSADRRLPGEFLFDADGAVGKALDVSGVPTHVVFDAAGREVLRSASFEEGVAGAVRELLAKPGRGASP